MASAQRRDVLAFCLEDPTASRGRWSCAEEVGPAQKLLGTEEVAVLRRACAVGVEVVVLCAGAESGLRETLARSGVDAYVAPVDESRAGWSASEARAAALADVLAQRFCDAYVTAVALSHADLGLLCGADAAVALRGAGWSVCAAADEVLPSREDGGLVAAVEAVCGAEPE